METLQYILNRFNLTVDDTVKMPLEIPNFGRNQLATLFHELGFMIGAEIGVERGEFSEILLQENPKLTLYSIDAWTAYKGYRDHTRQEKISRFEEISRQRLGAFGNRSIIKKGFSMDVIKDFPDNSLDFVYIDGNHDFINAAMDTYFWSKKVKKGGIISGHDYIKRRDEAAHVHVKQMLQGYTEAYKIRPWFVLGRDAVIEGEIRDSSRSWMFVNI